MIARTLIDTGAYFALGDRHDGHHGEAVRIYARDFERGRMRAFTTNFVVAETHALLLNRVDRVIARRFVEDIFASQTVIIRVSAADERRAREILVGYADKDFSYTDATSFAVMERLHITTAFAFDHHFAQFGFTILG